jgi:hypothetical protein
MDQKPLSQRLEELLAGQEAEALPTLNQILRRTEGEGLFLVVIVLCLPFVAPITPPGISTIIGTVIIFLTSRMMLGLPPGLPRWVGDRPLPSARFPAFIRASVKLVRFIERWVKPRGTEWLDWPMIRIGNASLVVFMAFLLGLPLPIWLTNTLPSYAIIFLAASMMEGDTRMIWVGYAWSFITTVYFGGLAVLCWFFPKYYQEFLHYLKTWL